MYGAVYSVPASDDLAITVGYRGLVLFPGEQRAKWVTTIGAEPSDVETLLRATYPGIHVVRMTTLELLERARREN